MTHEEMIEGMAKIVSKVFGIDDKPITATFTVDEWANIYASLQLTIDDIPNTEMARVCERIRAKIRTFKIDEE